MVCNNFQRTLSFYDKRMKMENIQWEKWLLIFHVRMFENNNIIKIILFSKPLVLFWK